MLAVMVAAGPLDRANAGEKEDNIREIIRITGSLDITEQMLDTLLQQMAQLFVTLNPGQEALIRDLVFAELRQVFTENIGDLEELTVRAYAAHFSAAEIAELLAFYQTPLGQRLIEELPEIMVESQTAGARWGQALGALAFDRVRQRLAAEGLNTPI